MRDASAPASRTPSIADLTQAVGIDRTHIGRMLRLTGLAPDNIEATLSGNEPSGMSIENLRKNQPVRWDEQRKRWSRRG